MTAGYTIRIPETKIRHFQDPTIIEIITTFLPDLDYGRHAHFIGR